MERGERNIRRILTLLNYSLAAIALLAALLVVLLRSVTHHPFYDECIQLRLIWLISQGLTPHHDFWSTYPLLGQLLLLPLFRIFPETPFVLLPLRFLTDIVFLVMGGLFALNGRRVAKDWLWGVAPFVLIIMTPKLGDFFAEFSIDHLAALSAVGTLLILLAKPTFTRLGWATALGILSLLIMPKYGLPLGGGWAAYTIYLCRSLRKPAKAIAVVVGTSAVTVGLVWVIYRLAGLSLGENLVEGPLFEARHMFLVKRGQEFDLWGILFSFLARHFPIGLLILGGLIGWGVNGFRKGGVVAWTGSGVLIGVVLSLFSLETFLEQYFAPPLLCLALFVPYLFLSCRQFWWRGLLTLVLLLAVLQADYVQFRLRTGELEETTKAYFDPATESFRGAGKIKTPPTIEVLANMKRILELIPEDEKVVAAGVYHPIFRRDLTFVTYDERPSFNIILPSTHVFNRPEYFAEALENDPPAYVCLFKLDDNYPVGWQDVGRDFLWRRRDLYQTREINGIPVFVRRDLIKRKQNKTSPEG